MKLSIQKHVFELLKHHDCVIITGLGGFILNHRPAYINEITNKIHPPSKSISFNKNLSNNDGLLANYIASTENLSYDEACLQIMKFSRKANLKLKKGETILFENIGELNLNTSKNIEFTINTLFNFNNHSYGLASFQIGEMRRPNSMKKFISAAAVIILLLSISIFSLLQNSTDNMLAFNLSPINNNNYSPREVPIIQDSLGKETPGIYNVYVSQVDFDLYKINGTNYHIETKKCFKLGFGRDVQIKIWRDQKDRIQRQVCFLNVSETEYDDCYKITNVYNEITSQAEKVMVLTKRGKMKEAILVLEETYIDPYVIANSIPEDNIPQQSNTKDSLSIKNIGNRFMDAIQTLGTPTENNEHVKPKTIDIKNVTISNETNTHRKSVYIIVGSFSDQKNAEALSKQLYNRGFNNAKIIGQNENGLIRVAADSFYTEEEAHLVLENIKKQLSSAWVLNTNKK
ncbi:MAG: hypothetical protein CMP56_02785 [Flavobacteriales bacterium]|nr:hypothetical protein [Flavobacteriales bacterium]